MKILILLLSLLILGCSIGVLDHPTIGQIFNADIWANSNGHIGPSNRDPNFYKYVGIYDRKDFYIKDLDYDNRDDFRGGILVSDEKIVGVLSEDQMIPILKKFELEIEREREVQNSIIKCDAMVKNVSLNSNELSDGLTPGKSIGQVQIIKKNKKTKKIKLCFTGDKCYRSDILSVDNCHIRKTPYYIGDKEDWYIPE